jgi:Condensation domain
MADGNWTISERMPVRFTGGRARTGPATLGQTNMVRSVGIDDPAGSNARLIWEVPSGVDLARLVFVVTTLLLRHDSLRTTFPEAGRQSVAGEGELEMLVYEADDAYACADDVAPRLRAIRFDPATELPVRAAVITSHGAPAGLILILCHTAVDAASQSILRREVTALLAGEKLPPPAAIQPVDLGETEQTPAGQRRIASALRYWDELLSTTPQAMFAVPGVGPTDWMLPRLTLRSTAAAPALSRIADRTGAGRATVVLAALCALIGRRLGVRTAVVAMLAANRLLPQLTDYVGTISQDALMSAELDVTTLDELVGRIRDRSLAAYRRSTFDSVALWNIIDGVAVRRGTHWARDCVFNDLTGLGQDGSSPAGDVTDSAIRLEWLPAEAMPTRLMVWAVRLDDEVELSVLADPACLSTADVEAFGSAIIRLIVEAADRDIELASSSVIAELEPVVRGDGWFLVDRCWIELAAVRQLLDDVLDGRPTLVVAVPDDELGHRLDCYVAGDHVAAERIHADCVAALELRPNAMAPHRYVLCSHTPADLTDLEAWRALAVAERTGRAEPKVAARPAD